MCSIENMVATLIGRNDITKIFTTLAPLFVSYVNSKEHASSLSSSNENFTLHFFQSINEILKREQDDVLSRWRKNFEMVRSEKLKAVLKVSDPGEEGIAGGTLQLANGTILYLEGSGVQMMFDFKESLNLTVEYSFTSGWGEAWSMVQSGDVDLGVPLRTIQYSLGATGALKSVALLHPLVAMSSNVYFRPPPLGPTTHYLLFWPLQLQTWLVLLALWFFCVFVCYAIHNIYRYPMSPRSTGKRNTASVSDRFFVSELLLWTVAIISGKDYPVPRKGPAVAKISTSLRIALLSAMFLSIILLAVYTAKIMATFSLSSVVIKSPEDLLKYKYTLASYSFVHMERIFMDFVHKPDIIKKAVDLFLSIGGRKSAMKRLLALGNPDPRFAFLTHFDGFYVSANNPFHNHTIELCSVSVFMSAIKSPRSMYVNKGSKFRDILNWKILQISETGINFRYQKAFGKNFEYTCFNRKRPYQELNIEQTSSLFLLLAFGASLAIFIHLSECLQYNMWGRLKTYFQLQSF